MKAPLCGAFFILEGVTGGVTGDRHLSPKSERDRGQLIFLLCFSNCPSVTPKKDDRCLSPVTSPVTPSIEIFCHRFYNNR